MKTTAPIRFLTIILLVLIGTFQSQAEYVVLPLTKEDAEKSGLTVKSRTNDDAGIKVWIEIDKDGPLANFTWIELRMETEEGHPLLSTRLQPHPVAQGQSKDIVTVSFITDPAQLKACSFRLWRGGGLLGGEIITIKVSDFLDIPEEPSI